jgi:hypothetical protein
MCYYLLGSKQCVCGAEGIRLFSELPVAEQAGSLNGWFMIQLNWSAALKSLAGMLSQGGGLLGRKSNYSNNGGEVYDEMGGDERMFI